MAQIIEFITNHWMLASLWVLLLITLLAYLKAKSGKAVSPQEATILINRSNGLMLDVRERAAFERGHVVDAINIPSAKLVERIAELEKNKDNPIIVVCQMGHQSGDVVKVLEGNGFSEVCRMSGGMAEWQVQNLPVVK